MADEQARMSNYLAEDIVDNIDEVRTARGEYDSLDERLDEIEGGGPSPSSDTPAMDGTGAAGTADTYARGDHVHPTDTSRQAAIDSSHPIASECVSPMTGYSKSSSSTPGDISTSDTLNAAIGKLEKRTELNENNISFVASRSGKNVLKFDSVGGGAYSGITYTVNDDGTVRASGTASANSYEYLRINNSNLDVKKYTNGQFVLSGCPSGGGSDTYSLYAARGNYAKYDYGDGVILTPTSESEISIVLRVEKNQTVDIVFKPMIRLIGTDSTFEPYALTNAELTAAIQALQAQLANQ